MTVSDPLLSVVIIVGNQRERAARCLQSILGQSISERLEVLLMDCALPSTPPLAGGEHPHVRVIRLAAETLFAQARVQAVHMARAPIVAFIEEHVIAFPGWAEAMLKAHEGPWAGVGCEVHNGNPGVGISDAVALTDYAAWMPPAIRGESDLLFGHNSSYKRAVLLNYGADLEVLFRTETILHWMLHKDGHRLFVEPDAKIAHINETTLGSMVKGFYLFSRCFGPTRAQVFNWSLAKRVVWVALTPFIPFVRLLKIFVFLARRRPGHLAPFFRNIAAILAAQFYAAWGQAMGLILGMGDADLVFSIFERDEYRAQGQSG